MCESMSLSTKQITRCTLRFYDPEFVKNLNSLYKKVGGTQSSFLGMLIKEGYKVVSLSLCCKLAFWSIEPILFNTPSKQYVTLKLMSGGSSTPKSTKVHRFVVP